MPAGRPLKFAEPVGMLEAYNSYEKELSKDEIADVEGFCVYIDSYRDLFSEYESKPEFSDTIKKIKNRIYARKKQLAMQNKMNAAIFIFDAKNNFGYVDKQESSVDVTSKGESINPNPELASKFSDFLKAETEE